MPSGERAKRGESRLEWYNPKRTVLHMRLFPFGSLTYSYLASAQDDCPGPFRVPVTQNKRGGKRVCIVCEKEGAGSNCSYSCMCEYLCKVRDGRGRMYTPVRCNRALFSAHVSTTH